MPLKLMYITNNAEVAKIADKNGVDWIFVDLEVIGKNSRQGNLDTVKSNHSISDITIIKPLLKKSKMLVRVNPIHDKSKSEIDDVINAGADIIMLPYFKTVNEVEKYLKYVNGRVKTCLLCETKEAVEVIDDILDLSGIDMIHIGLNDLHLSYKMKFMFELLVDGTVEMLCEKIRKHNIPYGFGGIAKLCYGDLPAELVIAEHYRLGSSMAILSRSFCDYQKVDDYKTVNKVFYDGLGDIRRFETLLKQKNKSYFIDNQKTIKKTVEEIILKIEDN